NVVGFLRSEMAAEYRRAVAKWTHNAQARGFKAGHVMGGRLFGYDNVCSSCSRVIPAGTTRCCPAGHTDRRKNKTEEAVILRIFDLSATGAGYTRIAKTLNGAGAVAPQPHKRVSAQRARRAGRTRASTKSYIARRIAGTSCGTRRPRKMRPDRRPCGI